MSDKKFEGRIALVTGATRGIGRAVAVELARGGAHLLLIGRTEGALEEVDDEVRGLGATATLITLDLARGDKVDALGPSLFQRWEHLDILVGNAGVLGPISPLNHISDDAWDEVMAVNVTANWRLLRTCDPLLRRATAGRALFVTSGAAHKFRPYWGAYATSKAALEALVKTYANEVANTSVRANLFNPGPVRTQMRARAVPGEDPLSLPTPEEIATQMVRLLRDDVAENGVVFESTRVQAESSG